MKTIVKMGAISTALFALPMMANADVLASVKPLGFITSAIVNGVTDTQVLVPTGASPHDYSLKLSDIQKVKSADLVLWVGEDIDSFLEKPVSQIDRQKVMTIAELADIKPLLTQAHHEHAHENDDHNHQHEHKHEHKAGHEHNHDHEHHDGLSTNWHVWYSPKISQIVAQQVADKLIGQFPTKKAVIEKNLADFNRTLAEQSDKINAQLAPFKEKGFFVFHDAYGYFNDAYGLKQTGYFTINPLVAPGAKTLAHIKEEIAEHRVNCLFAEPQFTPKVVESLAKGTSVNVGRLDPIGDGVALGMNSYANFLQATADSYTQCLSK
ncbi:zinc ABC transporter substrate-binding protein ZnuA [Rodentibacter heidelbergensis]|uniref:High-affinity zinc uptake system protein ZnuA n=1 Tax=Rodentibacter heidelbergensis TaxID=1908258 RepID=A0A1V3I7T6_9PAST|nr:zinc ABC transporter substrate-binding protein ZnuA [Rodentibacter heidelbergensis]OOF36038.1 zinc ABC transporter substrate-binding protein [Rodentibacter heidelbergensis]